MNLTHKVDSQMLQGWHYEFILVLGLCLCASQAHLEFSVQFVLHDIKIIAILQQFCCFCGIAECGKLLLHSAQNSTGCKKSWSLM